MDLVTALLAAGLLATTASVGTSYVETRGIEPPKPEYTYKPSVKGLFYSTLEQCAGKPEQIKTNYPLQTWEYSDCTVTLDANHVSGISGECRIVRECR